MYAHSENKFFSPFKNITNFYITLQKQDTFVKFPCKYLYPSISTAQFWSQKLYFCFVCFVLFLLWVTVTVEIHVSKVLRVTVGCTASNETSGSLSLDSE